MHCHVPWLLWHLWESGTQCLADGRVHGENVFVVVQACSILYKMRLPLLLAFNKVDVARHEFALEWMRDYETFMDALKSDSSYASELSKSLSLVCLCDTC